MSSRLRFDGEPAEGHVTCNEPEGLFDGKGRKRTLLRIGVEPDEENGLRKPCQIVVDKMMTVRRDKAGAAFGRIGDEVMISVNRSLVVFLDLA